jgi:hypothetical protein
MSEQLKDSDNDNFMPEGFKGNPSLYGEEQMIHDYSTMTTECLEDKAQRFISILNDPATLPKHRAIVARLLDHVVFECTYRDVIARDVTPNTIEGVA